MTISSERHLTLHEWASENIGNVPSVCDVGCGDGSLLRRLQEIRPDLKLMGVDDRDRHGIEGLPFKVADLSTRAGPGSIPQASVITCLDLLDRLESIRIPQALRALSRRANRVLVSVENIRHNPEPRGAKTVKPVQWWVNQLGRYFFVDTRHLLDGGARVGFVLYPRRLFYPED